MLAQSRQPLLGSKYLDAVSPTMIRDWHTQLVTGLRESLRAKDEARVKREAQFAKTSRAHRRPRLPKSRAGVRTIDSSRPRQELLSES